MTSAKPSKKMPSNAMKQSRLSFNATKSAPSTSKAKGKKVAGDSGSTRAASVSSGVVDLTSDDDSSRSAPVGGSSRATEVAVKKEELDLQDKAGRWSTHHGRVREKMGNIPPVHGEGQTKIHHILRVFDNSHEYGPCVGVSRLERWERALALGLEPPVEVRDILLTRQGVEEMEFSQSVFYGEV